MAKKKEKQIITVKEADFTVSNILSNLDEAPLELQIATYYKIMATAGAVAADLAELKQVASIVEKKITTTKYGDHITALVNRGLISNDTVTPIIRLENEDGSIYNISMSGAVEQNFSIAPELKKDLDILDDKYKKVTVALDEKVIKKEFEDGTLPSTIGIFCEVNPMDVTKLKKSTEKAPDPKPDGSTN